MLVLLLLGTVSVDCVHHLSSKCRARDAWCKCHVASFFIVSLHVLHCMFCCCSQHSRRGRSEALICPIYLRFSVKRTSRLLVVFLALVLRRLTLLWPWLSLQNEYHHDTHNILMTPLSRSLARPPCGSKANCHGSPCCIRGTLILWALWRFTMMALIVSIMISDGFNCAHCDWRWCHCLLLLVATVPSSDPCIVFTARIFQYI